MAGYTKSWMPPVVPLRDDLTAWKALFKDVHDNLIAAGLVQSATAGQLDIDAVASLPTDGSYAGFIEYEFNDALQATAPIVIKLEYGCGSGSLRSGTWPVSRTPRIQVTVSFAGGTVSFACPQTFNVTTGTDTTQATVKGTSFLCYNASVGFLGCIYGAGSRDFTQAFTNGTYIGATLCLLVARSTNSSGTPTADGVRVYYPGLDAQYDTGNLWTNLILPVAYSGYIDSTGTVATARDLALRIGGNVNSTIGSEIKTQQVFSYVPALSPWPWLVTYAYLDITTGVEFDLPVFTGPTTRFIAVGRETSLSVDSLVGQRAAIAMLWE